MHVRLTALAAALMVSVTPAWATDLPAYETYSAAADFGTNFFSSDPTYTQLLDTTTTPGATAQISGSGYTASASTNMGSNHAYASASTMPANVLSAGGFSGWYDQVTITGGSGTGTANFTVQLSGTADVGAMAGGLGYTLGVSSVHPSLLTSNTLAFNAINTTPWALDAATPIASYLIGASPYNDTSILFSSTSYPTDPTSGGIPTIQDPNLSLGGDAGMGLPTPDLILTPGSGQSVNITLHGTLNFTYGEAFYLISGLGATVIDGVDSFCQFSTQSTCSSPPKDGTGATTLDFSNSANLVNIALPDGATASFVSGNAYNVTTVPEPGAWLMLLTGLGLVGWRARRCA
ncbi:MAG: hypothetical protein A2199_11470 [Hydrogenophilales bacterium RIFOXYA1_FULL_63_33]|nr:MAG: hypothetical protein A2199_11470 [Hydrogenophilales bacterium RIFOXYA1_FULL_63_33]